MAGILRADDIFIERLWRSPKHEADYLAEIEDRLHAWRVIGEWIAFYNAERPHSALEHRTLDEAYWGLQAKKPAA